MTMDHRAKLIERWTAKCKGSAKGANGHAGSAAHVAPVGHRKHPAPGTSVRYKLLRAAGDLDARRVTFSVEDLAVRAWQKYGAAFGLKGYEDRYPNNKTVEAAVYGIKGLVHGSKWLEVKDKVLRLTPRGRDALADLLAKGE